MKDNNIEVKNIFIDNNNIFEKKYDKSIDVFGEIESLYKELSYVGKPPVIPCDKVSGENLSWMPTKWAIEKENGARIFESDKYSIDEIWEKDLNELVLESGTKLFIKALIASEESKGNVILLYSPYIKTTAYFDLNGNALNTNLNYIGIIQ